jgi:outer membrane lipoprotein carrier protein
MDLVKFWRRRRPRISRRILTAAFCGVLPACAVIGVQAQEPGTQAGALEEASAMGVLERFIANVDDLSARFEQQEFDADNLLIERSSGEFLLLRPDRYVLHYETPEEQVLVADGETLWIYDVELEQVTPTPQDETAGSPAALLSGKTAVSDAYLVRESPALDGRQTVELVPFEDQVEFSAATIEFRDDVPTSLELVDSLGERTRIDFLSIEINAGIDPGRFEFTPPRGVDVVGR